MRLALLMTPLAEAAWFDSARDVAKIELRAAGLEAIEVTQAGAMTFLEVEAGEDDLPRLARLSFVQGIFAADGDRIRPLDVTAEFRLPASFVYGQKYQGKTNEVMTQLAINLALSQTDRKPGDITLFDPMAGRGTTLLTALRYGMNAFGVEQEAKAVDLFHAHVKKTCKLERVKHRTESGHIGKQKGEGQFSRFTFGGRSAMLVCGDSAKDEWLQGRKFDLIVTDLPYGIQHQGRERRNPIDTVTHCGPTWTSALRKGGVIMLVFNELQTRRSELSTLFGDLGCQVLDIALPHRMSESILRDVLLFKKP